ncbi:COQ9 family protein [Sphingomonas sp.]|jgi:ubiquinone biosynthesis protein COQ9|uniref:COQ9 family protein n=1 Tax=Sphingomonas sp. TaxID=28214 RepID=UPI002DE3A0C4|nr:COQ9 family protein [Sphingomonas sp.]HEV2567164.1 COQ9 family protein [Sphingomonas sp.]
MTALPDDPTLDEIRAHLAPLLPANAAFDGWTPVAVELAAEQSGVDKNIARLAFKDGAVQMIDAWFRSVDHAMAARLPVERLAAMKVRGRVTELVWARIEIVAPEREALRRALAILAMPQNAYRAAQMGWRAVDLMWRLAGDTATDFNHYTKRATLGAVYASTVLALLDDETADLSDTRAFLERRIDNVMQFERLKADWKARSDHRPSLSRFIGRLRYPAV